MKELSIEEKAKAYDMALEIANAAYKDEDRHLKATLERIFPGLCESEDEKIRKELIEHVKDQQSSFISAPDCRDKYEEEENNKYNSWLAWLEKQGKSDKIVERAKTEKQRVLITESDGEANIDWDTRSLQDVKLLLGYGLDYVNKLEKQGEQKSVDKVEPKFKVGDWVTNGLCAWRIDSIDEDMYYTNHYGIDCGGDIESIDKEYHLWTIQDAKAGDVIYLPNGNNEYYFFIFKGIENATVMSFAHFYKYNNGTSEVEGTIDNLSSVNDVFQPATKEQRDTLERAMADAGYTFDFDKKELKKIGQTSAWSEEDEEYCQCLIKDIENSDPLPTSIYSDCKKWLKSLKDRIQPQSKQEWSEEEQVSEEFINALGTMLNDGLPDRYLVSEERIKKSAELLFSIAREQLKNEMQEWSEEDEQMLKAAISFVELSGFTTIGKGKNATIEWLKSLRPQNTWKPSDEQMKQLGWIAEQNKDNMIGKELISLYQDLKKLREE